jgi:cell wall-associated NlpC family hydrolase
MPLRRTAALLLCLLALQAWAAPADDDMPAAGVPVTPGLLAQWSGSLTSQFSLARQSVGERATDMLTQAMGLLGVPYRRGGSSEETGFDCSGFVRHMYEKSFGRLLPRRANEQAKATETIDREELKPGDLVFFNTMKRAFSHVGIYMGDGKFIHAPRAGKAIRVDDMRSAYWQKRFNGARRVPAEDAADVKR